MLGRLTLIGTLVTLILFALEEETSSSSAVSFYDNNTTTTTTSALTTSLLNKSSSCASSGVVAGVAFSSNQHAAASEVRICEEVAQYSGYKTTSANLCQSTQRCDKLDNACKQERGDEEQQQEDGEESEGIEYRKIPIKDLINSFESQTRPIMRYKLANEQIQKKVQQNCGEITHRNYHEETRSEAHVEEVVHHQQQQLHSLDHHSCEGIRLDPEIRQICACFVLVLS